MNEYVALDLKRNRGWPWPQDSWGLTPMYGEDGWCRSCGVPTGTQVGSIVLKAESRFRCEGAWVPNWQFDVLCLGPELAGEVRGRFPVELREVRWSKDGGCPAEQLVVPTIGDAWFAEEELRAATKERHGTDGARCPDCGVWRWLPLPHGTLPPLRITADDLGGAAVAASPEWFGDGWKAFRQILVRRDLATLVAGASPRDLTVVEVA